MKRFLILISIYLCFSPLFAADQTEADLLAINAVKQGINKLSSEQLEGLASLLSTARKDAASLLKQINSTKDEAEKKRIQADLDKVNSQIDDLMVSIEKIAAGKLEQDLLSEAQSKGFDWQRELEEIFKPIVVELKQMTERPRKIEKLRSEKAFYEERLPVAVRAVDKISEMKQQATSPELKKELKKIEDRWLKRRNEIESKLKITKLELDQLLAPEADGAKDIVQSLQDFMSGRGLSLVLAIGIFVLSIFAMRSAHRIYDRRISRNRKKRQVFAARLVNFLFSTLTIVIALVLAMSVLSFRGDWLLLGLLLIILVAAGLALRHSLPLFFREAKILLNIGPVREDERIIYNGLPWRVADLSVYTTLVNPMLTGGRMRLTLDELATLHSRPTSEKEIWFPTRENDFVILDDNTFGRVLAQTPEYVQMMVAGSVQTFPVQNFLGKSPRNLSVEGFGIMIQLGLDYRYQSQITTQICEELTAYMRDKLQQHAYGADLKDFIVEFNEAAASSLNIAIIGVFHGAAAANYNNIRRLLNKLSVDACNHFGWSIPFNQISVHVETPINFKPELAAEKS